MKKLQEQEEFKRGGVKRPGEEKLEQFFDVAFDYIRENNKYQVSFITVPGLVVRQITKK